MAGAAKKYRHSGHCRFNIPRGGSQGWALIARDEASSSHPRLLFMGLALHGVSAPEQEIHLLARLLAVRRRSGAALYPNVIEPPAQLLAGLEERHPFSSTGTAIDPSTNPLRGIGAAGELYPAREPLTAASKVGALPQTPPGAEPLDLNTYARFR